jgi:hypothetical protein
MPKKTRTSQSQRAREEQWRRRAAAQYGQPVQRTQARPGAAAPAVSEDLEDLEDIEESGESAGYQQANLRPMPSNVTTSAAATRSMTRTGTPTTGMPTAGQRRALATGRGTRARLAMNTMSLEEEMHYVRADIRRLILLTVACLAIIIVLAFILNR